MDAVDIEGAPREANVKNAEKKRKEQGCACAADTDGKTEESSNACKHSCFSVVRNAAFAQMLFFVFLIVQICSNHVKCNKNTNQQGKKERQQKISPVHGVKKIWNIPQSEIKFAEKNIESDVKECNTNYPKDKWFFEGVSEVHCKLLSLFPLFHLLDN